MISVIIPVYNVEPYLRQCLNSVISQTCRDIEIILIDDGSTDGCGAICDEYRERDERVTVFHTENRGLSAARNLGIDNAKGEWLMFVDSDDWVEPQYCELPLKAAEETGADLVIFDRQRISRQGEIFGEPFCLQGIVSAQDAADYGRPAVWNKLYGKSLFDTVRYPEGRLYEDVATTHRLIYRANRIAAISDALYNYRVRENSISKKKDERLYRDLYFAHLQRYDDLISFGHHTEELERVIAVQSLRYLMRVEPREDAMYDRADETVSSYTGVPGGLDANERNALKVWRLNKTLFHAYCRAKGWRAAPSPQKEQETVRQRDSSKK